MKWPVKELGEISQRVDYGLTASASRNNDSVKFLRITDIQNGEVNWDNVPGCACPESDVRKFELKNGDIVFARTGGTTGKSFLILNPPERAVFASYLIRVRLHADVDFRYVRHYFDTPGYWASITECSTGSTQPGVNASKLKSLQIPLPPLAEQKRIAAILDKADAIRRKLQQSLRLSDDFLRSAFLDMFGSEKSPKCERVLLGPFLEFMTSGGRGWSQYYAPTGDRFIRSLDVQMNEIGEKDVAYVAAPNNAEATRTQVQENDVLLTITGSLIGRVTRVPKEHAGAYISQHVAILRLGKGLDPEFLARFLSMDEGQRLVQKSQYGQTKPGLNFDQIRRPAR